MWRQKAADLAVGLITTSDRSRRDRHGYRAVACANHIGTSLQLEFINHVENNDVVRARATDE